jgi:HAE1 family hydrophobic/amphiphilic exporter-1
MFGSGTDIYLRMSGTLIRKSVLALVVLAVCGLAGLFLGSLLPSSFLPDEDQGYLFINMQLPNAASQERTAAASRDVEKILSATPAVQYDTSIVGFSLLSNVRTSYNAFYFVTLKPWSERQTRAEQYQQSSLEPAAQQTSARNRFQLLAASNPWSRHFRRISVRAGRPCRTGRSVFGGQFD